MKKLFLVLIGVTLLNFTGCGSTSKEAKELLQKLLQLVGIPQSIVVNICQDANKDGICNLNEPTATIAIAKGDTAEKILEKFEVSENGRYILEHYDPTLEILMEIADDGRYNTGKHVTLPFTPKPIIKDTPQELSILQSLADNGFLEEQEYQELREAPKARNVIDQILLENVFQNQQILEEHNITVSLATDKNLEFMADGLRELNVTELVDDLNNCENNTSQDCRDVVIAADDRTEINKQDATIIKDTNSTEGTTHTGTTEDNNKTVEISDDGNVTVVQEEKSEKNGADGYIVKLSTPATAKCYNSDFSSVIGTYNSDMTVGANGKLIFNGITLNDHCSVTIHAGATIDSNNNGQIDADDKTLAFDMKSIGDTTYISPLTTLMYIKNEQGEDITSLKAMVKDFDPVASVSKVNSMSGTSKTEAQKLLALMEVLKTALSESNGSVATIENIDVSSVITTAVGEDFSDFDIESILGGIPSDIAQKARAKAKVGKRLVRLNRVIDKDVIDISTLSINISDGGLSLLEALKKSVKASAPESVKTAIADATDINTLVPYILKNGYSADQESTMTNYFNELSTNLSSMLGGTFDITFGNMDVSMLIPSRYFGFDNLSELDSVYKVYSLDDITPDGYYYDSNKEKKRGSQINHYHYYSQYQKSSTPDNVGYKIVVNHSAKFEIVDGLDSQYFDISKGNREVAYIDLKDNMDSPTEQRVYKVEIKATDVQTLESKSIVLKFKIDTTTTTDANPITTEKGYISKDAVVGGVVLDSADNYEDYNSNDVTQLIHTDLEISSINLAGEGAEDFEIFDNKGLKVVNALDYDAKPEYNLTVVIEDANGNEFNQSLNIQVTNDSNRTVEFRDREALERTLIRTNLLKNSNFYRDDYIYLALQNENPAKFEIVDGLDSKFFRLGNGNRIEYYNFLDDNSTLSPTYKSNDDANGDGIYEVVVKATDVQTLEESSITIKFKLVSSDIHFFNEYNYHYYNYNYYVNKETVIGGEVRYTAFFMDRAEDVNITDMNITGEGAADFNLTNNALTVTTQLTEGDEYNLTIHWKDTSGYSGSQNILVHVRSEYGNHNDLDITNMSEIHLNRYTTNWYDYWYDGSWNGDIDTNNLAKATLSGDDKDTFMTDRFGNANGHQRYFYFNGKDYNNERPTYLNPKDSDQDNIYKTTVTLTDIQNLQTKSLDFTLEMLSHQVRPYDSSNNVFYVKEANITMLSIPKYAPIGGELLTTYGAKGFYTEYGKDITFSDASLEGEGADNFAIGKDSFGRYTNTITLAKSLADSNVTDFDLTVVIGDDQNQESRHPLHIHIDE